MGIEFLLVEILVWRLDYIVYYRKSHFANKALNDCERVVDGNIAELDCIWGGFLQWGGCKGGEREWSTKIDDFFAVEMNDTVYSLF